MDSEENVHEPMFFYQQRKCIYLQKDLKTVTLYSGFLKRPGELGNPNSSAKVKLRLNFFFIPAQEIVCRETEVVNTISSDETRMNSFETSLNI